MTSKRWMISALILSLVANGVLIGYLLGNFSRHEFRPPLVNSMVGARHILAELPPARRDMLEPLLNQHLRDLRPNLREIRSAQSDIRAAILADPFDPEALRAALNRFQQRLGASQAGGNDSYVAFVAALNPREREILVKGMNRSPGRLPSYPEHRFGGHADRDDRP
ncbi:MAG: periplasmic heavy metal sensor [Pseudomonadales bacterium]|nr:periplasmic heavy metal sensor [Pseudomonadales bacterium]